MNLKCGLVAKQSWRPAAGALLLALTAGALPAQMSNTQARELREKIRAAAYRTASEFVWEEVIDNLIGKLGYLARKQNLSLD